MFVGAALLLAVTVSSALAQGRGHRPGREKGPPPGQAKRAERADEARFYDHDREIARNWYAHSRHADAEGRGDRDLPPGLRDRDRLPPGLERRLQRGWVVDREVRRRLYPPPVALVRGFAPPPPGYRYFVFGGHIVLVDPGYRVLDVIHLEINLGL